MLSWDRTSFDKGHAKVFHVLPYGSTAYSDLAQKYGGDNVFLAKSATAENLAFRDAIAACTTGRNDLIRVYPGTYTLAATITVNKACTIESADGNPESVWIDCATSDVNGFTTTSAAAGGVIRNLSITAPDTTNLTGISLAASTHNFLVENVTIVGDDTAAQVGINAAASCNYVKVRDCRFILVRTGVKIAGSDARVSGCFWTAANATSGVGIQFMTGARHLAWGNTLNGTHANCLPIRVGTTSQVTVAAVWGNRFNAAQAVLVTNDNSSSFAAYENATSGVTGGAVWDAT